MDLSEYLIQAREEDKSYTQIKFAEDLGISHYTLNRLIRARQIPSAEMAYDIEVLTNGKVRAWDDILLKAIKKKRKNGDQ